MKKNTKIIFVLSIAIIMALLSGYAIVSFLTPHRATIYIFNADYDIGKELTSDMLVPLQVDSNIVVGGVSTSISSNFVTSANIESILRSGDSLKVPVAQNMPLMKSLLSISGGNSIIMSMAPSSVAVTVEADSITGVTKDLYPGAYVNVYVTSYSGGTFLLFEEMRILNISKSSNGGLVSVTFEVNNEQAVKLINSTKNGSIHLGLINANGYVFEDGTSPILVNPEAQQEEEPATGDQYDILPEGVEEQPETLPTDANEEKTSIPPESDVLSPVIEAETEGK